MTVTIHARGVQRSVAAKRLIELANGDVGAIGTSTAGLVVSDDLALAYLTGGPPAAIRPAMAVPPSLADTVRAAEVDAGMVDQSPVPQQATKTAARKTAKSALSEAQL